MESPPGNASLLWFLVVQNRKAIIRAAALLVGLFAAMFFGSMALDAPRAPWLRSFGLWPTLTGPWQGQLGTADGPVTSIYLEIGGVVTPALFAHLGEGAVVRRARGNQGLHHLRPPRELARFALLPLAEQRRGPGLWRVPRGTAR